MDDILIRAGLAGFATALAAGPLGAAVVWGRLAFFGDALAHASLLGIVLAVVADVHPWIGVAGVGLAVALGLAWAFADPRVAPDALLAAVSYGALAAGLVVLGMVRAPAVNLFGFLFGDILGVGSADLLWAWAGAVVTLLGLAVIWRPLVAMLVHADLAAVEGVPVRSVRLAFLILLALMVAGAMKTVGVLLVTALLVLPAAAARGFARTPEAMAVLAALGGCLAVAAGLGLSFAADAPSGPSIVCVAALLFALSRLLGRRA
ncbi:MAG: metal ABC transporter permease [Alphaproteobacteria bacterium]